MGALCIKEMKKGMVKQRMYKILEAKELTTNIYLMVVEAPRVAKNCQPGQFVIVRMDKDGERIPLTICDYDREKGTITIVFQTVGAETARMQALKSGDSFHDFVGPLGCASEMVSEDQDELAKKKILFVAGGVGTAPVYPQVKWLHNQGIAADVIVGAKNHDLLILEKEMEAVAGNLYITTDDGSYGRKGMVTQTIQELVDEGDGFEDDRDAYAMESVFFVPEEARWNTIASAPYPGDWHCH